MHILSNVYFSAVWANNVRKMCCVKKSATKKQNKSCAEKLAPYIQRKAEIFSIRFLNYVQFFSDWHPQ